MTDPTTLLLLQIILGLAAACLACVLAVASVWAIDTIFKTTRSYLMILEWRKAWLRERPKPAKPVRTLGDGDGGPSHE